MSRWFSTRELRVKAHSILSLFLVVFGLAAIANQLEIASVIGVSHVTVIFLGILGASVGASVVMYYYLRGEITLPMIDRLLSNVIEFKHVDSSLYDNTSLPRKRVENRLETIERKLEDKQYTSAQLDESQREHLLDVLKSTLGDSFVERITHQLAEEEDERRRMESCRTYYESVSSGLEREIESTARRANLNLIIGIVTTSIAVGLLLYMIGDEGKAHSSYPEMLGYYMPRLAVAIFIETFSFFFLRLYKSSLLGNLSMKISCI